MTKEEFQDLLQRYLKGECTLQEIHQIDNWFAGISDEDMELNESEKMQVSDRMLASIQRHLPSAKERRGRKSRTFSMLKIAASLSLIFLVAWLLANRYSLERKDTETVQQMPSGESMEYARNTTAEILTIQLPDASTVELKPDAEISYASSWKGQKREVRLTG